MVKPIFTLSIFNKEEHEQNLEIYLPNPMKADKFKIQIDFRYNTNFLKSQNFNENLDINFKKTSLKKTF